MCIRDSTYTADQSAADDLDAGDTANDVFTYTVSDGTTTTTATITITVNGINDTPVAQNDVGVIAEDSTLTVANGDNANVSGSYDATGEHSGDVIDTSSSSHTDSDADDSASLTITQIKKDGGSNSSVSSGSSYNSSGTSVTGTYGTLTIGADGSYTYVADQTAADALDAGDSANDVFVYTLSDGTATTTANITISVLGINDDPAAVDDTDTVSEGATVTKTGSQDDVLNDDTDADDSSSLTVTAIQPSGGSSSSVTSSSTYESNGTTVTGTYGTLTIGADGSYTYTADDPPITKEIERLKQTALHHIPLRKNNKLLIAEEKADAGVCTNASFPAVASQQQHMHQMHQMMLLMDLKQIKENGKQYQTGLNTKVLGLQEHGIEKMIL